MFDDATVSFSFSVGTISNALSLPRTVRGLIWSPANQIHMSHRLSNLFRLLLDMREVVALWAYFC
jgi:hypothetical protein